MLSAALAAGRVARSDPLHVWREKGAFSPAASLDEELIACYTREENLALQIPDSIVKTASKLRLSLHKGRCFPGECPMTQPTEGHTETPDSFAGRREVLLETLRQAGIHDERVLQAIKTVPREQFVAPSLRAQAFENIALPIEQGQSISQPLMVGAMTQALALAGTEQVLEIGTGSGYQAAILAECARSVVTVERWPMLA